MRSSTSGTPKVAVTDHAVDQYRERVEGAKELTKESIRDLIRKHVAQGFATKTVKEHPTESKKRIISFVVGSNTLWISIGPNETSFPGDIAAITVMFETEMHGRKGMGVTLGDALPALRELHVLQPAPVIPRYIVRIGTGGSESYDIEGDEELQDLLDRREPDPRSVFIYELTTRLAVRRRYTIERKKD
jgi:hypothetical protein